MPLTCREMGGEAPAEPVIFLKPSTAVCGPGDPILRPAQLSERVDYEGELAVVIGLLAGGPALTGSTRSSSATPAPTT